MLHRRRQRLCVTHTRKAFLIRLCWRRWAVICATSDLRMPMLVSELMDPESSDAAAEEQDDDTSEGIDESSSDDMLLLWLFGWDLGF